MKANELMIGDWLNLSDVDEDIIPCKVVELHTDELLIIQPQDIACDIVGYDMVRPIPLTPEILERNGFVKHDKVYLPYLDYSHERDGFIIFNSSTWRGYFLNSVHELQHALHLCRLNNLADNFKID